MPWTVRMVHLCLEKQSIVDVVNSADDDGGNEEGTESFGDNDKV